MNTITIVLLVILAVLAIALAVLVYLGKKAQKRSEEQQEAIIPVLLDNSNANNKCDYTYKSKYCSRGIRYV